MNIALSRYFWSIGGIFLFLSTAVIYAAQQAWITNPEGSYQYSVYGILLCGTLLIVFARHFTIFAALAETDKWYLRFPFQTGHKLHPDSLAVRFIQRLSLLFFILIPLILNIVFFNKFYHGTAYHVSGEQITRAKHFEYVPLCKAFDMALICPPSKVRRNRQWHYACKKCSMTYIRFWQPVILLVYNLIAVLAGLILLLSIFVDRQRNFISRSIWKRTLKAIAKENDLPPPASYTLERTSRVAVSRDQFPYDIFISYSRDDGDEVANQLAERLTEYGHRVWFDKYIVSPGVSLTETLSYGLSNSRYAVVVMSPNFFRKKWTGMELNYLLNLEKKATGIIIPLWHGVDEHFIGQYNQGLSVIVALNTKSGIEGNVSEINNILSK